MKTNSFIFEGLDRNKKQYTIGVTCQGMKLYDSHCTMRISLDGKVSFYLIHYNFTWKKFLDCVRLFDLNEKIYLRNPKTVNGKPVSIKRIYKKLIYLKINNSFNLHVKNHSIVLKKTSKSEI